MYGYALQSPLRYTDPIGLTAFCATPLGWKVCGEAVKQIVVGCVTIALSVGAWVMGPDEIEEYCDECEVANPQPCDTWYTFLIMMKVNIVMGAIHVSAVQGWIESAHAYNAECVPMGYPPIDPSFVE